MTRAADYPYPRVRIECPKCGSKGTNARIASLLALVLLVPGAAICVSASGWKRIRAG